MRNSFSILLMTAILFGAGYWFFVAEAVCDVPLAYRVGSIDSRFGITDAEVRNSISTAESFWENATGRNLFTYDPDGELVVNFVYDERQERADVAEALLTDLENKGNMNESVRTEYDRLTREYNALKQKLDARNAAYDAKLTAYNSEVEDWNARGGAPKDVFDRLEVTKDELAVEHTRLNAMVKEFNALVRDIRTLAAEGNSLASDYNETVSEYNDRVAEGEEFTQGEYTTKIINIYEFTSKEELELVLAHELGHALSLQHVTGESSVMYRVMGAQTKESGVTPADVTEFERVCGTGDSFLERVFR